MSEVDLTKTRASPSVLLYGQINSGKSHCIRTLLDTGVKKICILALEPGVEESYSDLPADKVSWMKIAPPENSMEKTLEYFNKIARLDPTALQNMGRAGKQGCQQWIEATFATLKFIDHRNNNQDLGRVFDWPSDWAFVIEGLTQLNEYAKLHWAGDSPMLEMRDYMVIPDLVTKFVEGVTLSTKCWVILTAHAERETNELTGVSQLMLSCYGRKLGGQLPRFFSEMIYCEKVIPSDHKLPVQFTWSTRSASDGIVSKARSMPFVYRVTPTFTHFKQKGL
jgi:hypothetical protein